MTEVIQTTALSKHYPTVEAVDDLSIAVEPGEIYGFLGLNGSGKTTTIRMLLGMIRPTSGATRIFGQDVHPGARDIWRQVGYLVETPHAYGDLTVRENLEVIRRLYQLADRGAIDRIINRLGLGPYAERTSRELSLGNLQRLGLASALIHNPALLILDEPVNGLDPAGVVEIRELLREHVAERGGTIFMSSHILGEVSRLATRIGIIHHGRLVQELTAAELEQQSRRWLVVDAHDRAAARAALASAGFAPDRGNGPIVLRTADAVERPDDIARLLVGNGVAPTRLSVEQEDLESHFLSIVEPNRGEPLPCTV